MRKMLKDQTYAKKKRVEDSRRRRQNTQANWALRREERRVKRYRQSPEHKAFQAFLNFNWSQFGVKLLEWQKTFLRAMHNVSKFDYKLVK